MLSTAFFLSKNRASLFAAVFYFTPAVQRGCVRSVLVTSPPHTHKHTPHTLLSSTWPLTVCTDEAKQSKREKQGVCGRGGHYPACQPLPIWHPWQKREWTFTPAVITTTEGTPRLPRCAPVLLFESGSVINETPLKVGKYLQHFQHNIHKRSGKIVELYMI